MAQKSREHFGLQFNGTTSSVVAALVVEDVVLSVVLATEGVVGGCVGKAVKN